VPVVLLFELGTVRGLAGRLGDDPTSRRGEEGSAVVVSAHEPIAIVGMAGRFPGADDVAGLWSNLVARVVSPPGLADADCFDAGFFGLSPRTAAAMDPQHRVFLECVWAAAEDAGYAARRLGRRVGVYAGAGWTTWFTQQVWPTLGIDEPTTMLATAAQVETMLGQTPDFLTTRASYVLGARGPSLAVQTACSTALVAVHVACKALRAGECDVAIAGAVAVAFPQDAGHVAEDGAIFSASGVCRAFDADADGTVFGHGVGAVVLKPLARALADGDDVYAVIRGSAVTQDGADRVGFTAPGVAGQAAVVAAALADAGVEAGTIGYVEAHGTGTRIGDPIEVAALTRAFRRQTDAAGFCTLGTVKNNIGHLGMAAGIAGLIKAALCLRHGVLPGTAGFAAANPLIDLENSPFRVEAETRAWPTGPLPRRAGVSAFGMGGTNAHVVLEEAPAGGRGGGYASTMSARVEDGGGRPSSTLARGPGEGHLLTLSARTAGQARELALRVAGWLGEHPEAAPGDVCATTRVGRRGHSYRLHAVGATIGELREGLVRAADGEVAAAPLEAPKVAFLFTGQGSQGIDMGRRLAAVEPVFRAALDEVDALASRMIGRSIVALMHPAEAERAEATRLLGQTRYAQPAIFAIGVALYRLWRSWGVTPAAVMGHSLGEYVAAYAAGALTLQGALGLVVRRAELMQALPAGGVMVSLGCAAEQVPLRGTVAIAAINAPDRTVIAGAADEVESVARAVAARGVEVRRLEVSHAFHSSLIEPMLAEFAAFAADVPWRAPEVPLVANVSGVVEHGVRGADEWRRHAREPVRFADGVRTLVGLGVRVFVELGARPMLSALGQRCVDAEAATWVASLRGDVADERVVREGLGELERLGVGIDWEAVEAGRRFRRVHLPGYPFARDRHWIGPEPRATEDRWRHRVVWSPVTVRPRALDGVVLVVPRGLVGDPIVAAVGEALAASERVVVEDDSFAVPRGRVVVSLLGLDEVHGLWWTVRLGRRVRRGGSGGAGGGCWRTSGAASAADGGGPRGGGAGRRR
jgi:acyl transferase domain-containing protein